MKVKNNSINQVEFNISSNKKLNNLETYIGVFFEKKIKPYLTKKIDSIDSSLDLSIDKIQIDLSTLKVKDINNLSVIEQDQLFLFFKEKFDAKLNNLILQNRVIKNPIEKIQAVLQNGFVSTLIKENSSFNLANEIENLSISQTRAFYKFLNKDKAKQTIIFRLLQQLSNLQIVAFFKKVDVNYPLIFEKLNKIFSANQSYLPLNKEQLEKLKYHYFLSNKMSDTSKVEKVVEDFFSQAFSINIKELKTIENSKKILFDNSYELRDKYFKKEMSLYPKLLKKLNNYFEKVEIKNVFSKKELVYKFQNFLLENTNQLNNSVEEIIKQFIKLLENSKTELNDILTYDYLESEISNSLSFIPKEANVFYEFLKTGSFSIQSNNVSEKSALIMLLKFVRQKPFEVRKALFKNKVKALWYLISKFNDLDYEFFIHQLSPNFLIEKKKFFKFLENLALKNIIVISNFNQLSEEFNQNALQKLINKKELHFKTPKGLLINWVEDSKISKGGGFKNQNWENLLDSESEIDLIRALESMKQKSKNINIEKLNSNEEALISDADLLVSEDLQTATFYKNVLSHFLLFNEIPWWAHIQFTGKDLSSTSYIIELIKQFKTQFSPQFVQFLELIKRSSLLLESLVYKTNISVFNFLLKDLIEVKNITQIKLYLKDVSSISTVLFDSNLYQNQIQKAIYFSIIKNDNVLSLDTFFDQIFKAIISDKSVNLKNSINGFINLNLLSDYFTTFSIEDRLMLVNNKKQEVNESLFNYFSIDNFLYKKLFKDLISYIKTGVLKGILATNKSIYIDLFNEFSKDKNQREILLDALRESILPQNYFLLSKKEYLEESNHIKETKKSDLLDSDSSREQKIEQSNIQNDEKINIEVFKESEFGQLNILDEQSIELQLLYYKKSLELNIAIFKYFIFNMEMPWWSPFEDISEFQQQFTNCFAENTNILLKEMISLFSNEELSKKIFSFFDFKLSEPIDNLQLGKLVVNDLDQLIIKKWNIKENFPEIYSHFLALKLLLGTQVSIDKKRIAISEFLNYVISIMVWSSFKEMEQLIDVINELLTSINKKFNLSISIKESIETINKVKGNEADLTKQKTAENIATINLKIYNKLISLQTTQSNSKYEKVVSFLLAIKPLLSMNKYRYFQEIIISLDSTFTSKERYAEFDNKFFNQILKLIHLMFIKANNFSVLQLIDEMTKNNTELSNDYLFVEELQQKLEDLVESSDPLIAIPSSTVNDLFLVLKEKFPQEASVYLKAFTKRLYIETNIEVDLNATFTAFMYYLAIESQKDIRTLMLSFFRIKSINNNSIYPILMNINKEEVIENFEKTQPDLILYFELQFLLNKLDLGDFINQSAELLMELYKSLDIQQWSTNYILFIIQQFAQNKSISLINAFDSINKRVSKETQFNHLKRLKILLANFEQKEYFNLEEDTYNKTIKDIKSLSKISQKPENIVSEMIRQLKLNDQFLEQYKKFYKSEELKNEILSFQTDEVISLVNKGEQLQIYNAGLALIWPFVGTLFTKLGYIKDKAFIDKSNQFRAVHLLQYIIDGGDTSPEFVLVFNKLICGILLSDPLDMFVTLTKEEKHQADQFLESIKGKWREMKNTSLDTFRDSFLKREGTLTFDGKNWQLQVKTKPIDVLLRKLPWGISLIKFHWIDYIIFVEWTTKN